MAHWMITWRLLLVAMPLTIAALWGMGYAFLGLSGASSLLLAAALTPTDPVLASDVQVGPPKSGEEDDTRFALTSEAGLNDGLAFPFVMLAIAMTQAHHATMDWAMRWFAIDVLWRLGVGVAVGAALGYGLGWLVFRIPNRAKLSRTGDGFVALGITIIVFGVSEAIHGYGFVSVFVAGLALRAAERNNQYHQTLHDFSEQLERLLMMILLGHVRGRYCLGRFAAKIDLEFDRLRTRCDRGRASHFRMVIACRHFVPTHRKSRN
jgi:NhaP-type Na+/H+ or K+/H+ antiporter